MKIKERVFKIEDIDCECIVEVVSKQKDILDLVDEYVENLQYDWFNGSDDSFHIVYKDGTETFIDENYDGRKVKRKNIVSMVCNNPCTAIVYGDFEINEYGVVTAAEKTVISEQNITEIA